MRLGVATSIPWLPGRSQEECFLDALAEVEAAEALGFDVVWFTEHHFALHGLNSGAAADGLGLPVQGRPDSGPRRAVHGTLRSRGHAAGARTGSVQVRESVTSDDTGSARGGDTS
jgi:hypothetical protein